MGLLNALFNSGGASITELLAPEPFVFGGPAVPVYLNVRGGERDARLKRIRLRLIFGVSDAPGYWGLHDPVGLPGGMVSSYTRGGVYFNNQAGERHNVLHYSRVLEEAFDAPAEGWLVPAQQDVKHSFAMQLPPQLPYGGAMVQAAQETQLANFLGSHLGGFGQLLLGPSGGQIQTKFFLKAIADVEKVAADPGFFIEVWAGNQQAPIPPGPPAPPAQPSHPRFPGT